ncbi:tetratricopeptide repeat protein [Rhodanobacter ginsengisoli]|uniref:Tetratricopeptide repeat protein n=1 Tax=Rhodanobacter ginsengisoli TaxID=418646 RepID=A0ABW0QRA7_9GAMM
MLFYAIAAAMIAVALAALLLPLVRQGRRSGRSRGVFVLTLAIALVLPLATGWLYLKIGTPVAINGVAPQAGMPLTMQQAVAQLRAHLVEKPDDLQAWTLLAQTSAMLHNTADARDAYDHILKLDPNNADAMVGWAEADAMLQGDHVIGDRAVALLKHAVQLQPDSQRGLWLLGTSEFQQGNYAGAAATWRLLAPQLEPGSEVAKAVAEQISQADARAGGAPAEAASGAVAATATEAALQVQVSLASDLKAKLAPGDTLFIYARPVSGPPMPLAVARLQASQLPAEVTLTDAMAMTPTRTLSSVAQVFVGARISHSGQPIAQPGDLEGNAGIVDVTRKTPVEILIDKVH